MKYFVNLTSPRLKIVRKSVPQIEAIYRLNEYDFRTFDSETEAQKFIESYQRVAKTLTPLTRCDSGFKASILYKKRYMILTLMGLKHHTERFSDYTIEQMKKVKIGETFRLYDQTNFILVKLVKRSMKNGVARYDFKLA